MSFRTTVVLLAFVVLSLSQAPPTPLWHQIGEVSYGGPAFNATFGPYNVHDTASLTVKSTGSRAEATPVYFCIVFAKYGLPTLAAEHQYNIDNCIYYFNATAGSDSTTVTLALRNEVYQIGVYFSSPYAKKNDNTSLEITLTGDDCGATGYWNGQACQSAGQAALNEVVTADFQKGETKYWTFKAPDYVGYARFASTDASAISAVNSIIWARHNAVPSSNYHDAIDTDGNVTIVSARPGLWVFGVHAGEAGTGSFKLTAEICGPNSGGVGCMIPVANMSNNLNAYILQTPLFYRVEAVTQYPVIVSITTNNGSNIPYFYLSKGVIPTKGVDSADVSNCNGGYCDVVKSISFKVDEEAEYYVGVFPSTTADSGNQTFGIWWNSTCVAGCETENHGQCQDDGRCECEIDFDGIDCSVSKGLGPQYIVLIIIASLVVASAIIGFVAWAYMRRKRAAYEIVS